MRQYIRVRLTRGNHNVPTRVFRLQRCENWSGREPFAYRDSVQPNAGSRVFWPTWQVTESLHDRAVPKERPANEADKQPADQRNAPQEVVDRQPQVKGQVPLQRSRPQWLGLSATAIHSFHKFWSTSRMSCCSRSCVFCSNSIYAMGCDRVGHSLYFMRAGECLRSLDVAAEVF